jgi:hypothetical protein
MIIITANHAVPSQEVLLSHLKVPGKTCHVLMPQRGCLLRLN